ncbi:MAG: hypothetical protein H0X65_20610 [Gemmatimonadetes bacterium]|nr:hypothetical protein [Gemmatimonadota bacterium]
MTTKERLHQLVDTFAESEARTAACVLEALHTRSAPALYTLDHAPPE